MSPAAKNTKKSNSPMGRLTANSNMIFAAGLVCILATLLIPLPTFLLDIGIACSISLGIAVLIIVLGTNEPLDTHYDIIPFIFERGFNPFDFARW
jgi:flagellar biosynthesis protein FlhA